MRAVKWAPVMGAAIMLAACGGEKPATVEAAAATMTDGFYELSSEVTALSSTDNTTPATPLKVGDKQTIKACVVGGKPRPEFFAEMGRSPDKCEIKNSYIRNGRLSAFGFVPMAVLEARRQGRRGHAGDDGQLHRGQFRG